MTAWKWFFVTALFFAGLAFGYGAGIVVTVMSVATDNPMMLKSTFTGNSLDRVYQGMARLATDELIIENCKDAQAVTLALINEEAVLPQVRAAATEISLHPQLGIANALVILRKADHAAERSDFETQKNLENHVRDLLAESGWSDPSPQHFREQMKRANRLCTIQDKK